MAINVVGAITTTTAAVVRPRVSYSVVNPSSATTVTIPAAAVAYVDLVLGASLDTTGRYKFIADVSVVLDATAVEVRKLLGDAFALGDHTAIAFSKAAVSSITTADALTQAVAKALADSHGLDDRVAYGLAKASFDAFGFTDSDTFALDKLVRDGVGMNDLFDATDGSLYSFVKNVANVVFANEQLARDVSKKLQDSVAAVSFPVLHVQKAPFIDATGEVTDFNFLQPLLNKADTVSAGSVTTLDITKPLVDAFSYVEFFATAVVKSLADVASPSDASALVVDKPTYDIIYTTEHAAYDFDRPLADSVAFSDTVYAVRLFERTFEDLVAPSDYRVFAVSKALSDALSTPDSAALTHTKLLSDGFALNDLADVGDGIMFLLVQHIANVAVITDNVARQTVKGRIETISVTDSGLLVNQDYCDLTYFAEDYVGVARSF